MLNHYVLIIAVFANIIDGFFSVGKNISHELKGNKYEMADTDSPDETFELIRYGVIKKLILTLEDMRKMKEEENDENINLVTLKNLSKKNFKENKGEKGNPHKYMNKIWMKLNVSGRIKRVKDDKVKTSSGMIRMLKTPLGMES